MASSQVDSQHAPGGRQSLRIRIAKIGLACVVKSYSRKKVYLR